MSTAIVRTIMYWSVFTYERVRCPHSALSEFRWLTLWHFYRNPSLWRGTITGFYFPRPDYLNTLDCLPVLLKLLSPLWGSYFLPINTATSCEDEFVSFQPTINILCLVFLLYLIQFFSLFSRIYSCWWLKSLIGNFLSIFWFWS